MKARILSFVLACCMAGVLLAAPQTARAAETWALLIGVSRYQNPQISSLNFPAADAAGIRDVLTDPQLGAVPSDHVRLLTDTEATRDGIWQAVDEFLQPNVKEGDQVILFLAGHGVAKGAGTEAKSYLLPADVKGLTIPALDASAIDLRKLSERLADLPAAQFITFVDACREDPTPGRGVKGNLLSDVLSRGAHIVPKDEKQRATSVTFFACGVGQRAFEDPKLKHGVFTYWIMDAIKEAAVPQKPDGAVPMGRLASYVGDKVAGWAKQVSSKGGFEIEQTPETLASEPVGDAIVLMHVRRDLPDKVYETAPPQLLIPTFPEGAQVAVNGRSVGAGSVQVALDKGGEYELKVTASGYEPATRTVRVLDGLQYQIPVRLQPVARGAEANGEATELFQRALDAEERQQYEIAQAGYEAVIAADATYQPAYERLARLHALGDDAESELSTLVQMVKSVAPNARAYSLLGRAYAAYADRKRQEPDAPAAPEGGPLPAGDYRVPQNWIEAAALARAAADDAAKLDKNAADTQLALGFALTVAPDREKNRKEALAAFGRAAFAAPKDADAQYGLGYGIRNFAVLQTDKKQRDSELKRAVDALKQALALRPDFYDANRELAYCYHLLDETEAAARQYQVAGAQRGEATDQDTLASVDVALSSLYKQAAEKLRGNQKADYLAAADGYLTDAKEKSSDLGVAMAILNAAGLNTRISSYLPPEMQKAMSIMSDPAGAAEDKVRGEIRDKVRLPGGFRLPGF